MSTTEWRKLADAWACAGPDETGKEQSVTQVIAIALLAACDRVDKLVEALARIEPFLPDIDYGVAARHSEHCQAAALVRAALAMTSCSSPPSPSSPSPGATR